MKYFDLSRQLTHLFKSDASLIQFEGLNIYQQEFASQSYDLLPGQESYYCQMHHAYFNTPCTFVHDIGSIDNTIHIQDVDIHENQKFSYRIFMPPSVSRADKAIFLFHGFNEKNWDKYLPWAYYLAKNTQCAIILFPIAFHMNRTLSIWSNKRKMFLLSEKRKEMFPNVVNSSLSNVAISMRLHSKPQRFIWSGLQTYNDIIQFIEDCHVGNNPLITPSAHFHFMSYSIGCLLAEILKLSNPNNYFSNSKLCMFCGGAVFNRLSPVSKYILDSEANIALYAYMIEHIKKHMKQDNRLEHYIEGEHKEGNVFYSMLDYKVNLEFRENLFREVYQDLYAVALRKDTIIPPYEVINTLQGSTRDIPVKVDLLDFPFPYTHVNPFPDSENGKELINEHFQQTFSKIADFFNS